MKKILFILFIIICLSDCESLPDEPSCWECEFSTEDDNWTEYFCDMTSSEIRDYENQVNDESGGEIYVWCSIDP